MSSALPRRLARARLLDVGAHRRQRRLAHGDQPLLAPLAERDQVAGVEVDVAHPHLHQLGDAQPGRVQQLQHRGVARAARRAPIGRHHQAVDLVDGQVVGQLAPEARQIDVLGRIDGRDPLRLQELEQLAQRDQPPRLRPRRQLLLGQVDQEIEDVDRPDRVGGVDGAPGREVREPRQVAPVGFDSGRRQLPFDPQVVEELLDGHVDGGPHIWMVSPSFGPRKFLAPS